MSKTPQAIASNNTYGLDVPYFSKKLKLVLQGLNNYMPEELARELARLAKTSDEVAASGELSHALKAKNESAESRIAQLEADLAEARKDQARYKFVRGMEPEDFGNLSTYCDDFDCQVDDLMKRCKQ